MKHLMRMGSLLAMMMLLTMGTMMISCGGDDVTGLPVLTKVSDGIYTDGKVKYFKEDISQKTLLVYGLMGYDYKELTIPDYVNVEGKLTCLNTTPPTLGDTGRLISCLKPVCSMFPRDVRINMRMLRAGRLCMMTS